MKDMAGTAISPGDYVVVSASDQGDHYLKIGRVLQVHPPQNVKRTSPYQSIAYGGAINVIFPDSKRASKISTPSRVLVIFRASVPSNMQRVLDDLWDQAQGAS